MANFGKSIGDSLKRLVFRELTVARRVHLSEHFVRIDLAGKALRGVHFSPGDKLQLAFEGGPRTYTPFSFDTEVGALSVLVYLHGDGPSARWLKSASEGDQLFAFGPRSSLALSSGSQRLALFGDETSFALGRALFEARSADSAFSFVFEVTDASESRSVLDALELPDTAVVERREDGSHLAHAEARLRDALGRDAGTRLVLCGNARSIQTLRARLKAEPVAHAGQLVKAYWALGKRGLD